MATTIRKLQLKLTLESGKTAVLNLPEAVNHNTMLVDDDTGESVLEAAFPAIKAAYADDFGNGILSMVVSDISTTTATLATDFAGN